MSENSNRSSKGTVVIPIVILVLVVIAGAWYMFQYKPEQEAKEQARQEQKAQDAENKRKEQAALNKAKYEKLIENADAEYEQSNWQSAHSLYTEASALLPTEQYPQDQLAFINIKLDEIAALEARRAAGIIDTVASPQGRFYTIVSSSIDDDLAMDYARKLAKEGNNPKIIAHDNGKLIYYRVSLGDYDTKAKAESAIASFNTDKSEAWVLAY